MTVGTVLPPHLVVKSKIISLILASNPRIFLELSSWNFPRIFLEHYFKESMKRTVTQDGPATTVARRARRAKPARSSGKSQVPKSLGQPNGVHYIQKVAQATIPITDLGFALGATRTAQFAMQFNNTQFIFYINNAGSFVAANVPGYADISGLFDQVMLSKVTVKLHFNSDPVSVPYAVAQSSAPFMYHCEDRNDASVPADYTVVSQYGNVKSKLLAAENGPVIRVIKPCFASNVYVSALANNYQAKRGFVTAAVDTPHYGMKGALLLSATGAGTTTLGQLLIECKYLFACKNTL